MEYLEYLELVITRRRSGSTITMLLDGFLKLFKTSSHKLSLVKTERLLVESRTEQEKVQAEQAAEAAGIALVFY